MRSQLFGPVSRPKWVKIRATSAGGDVFEFKADGILGRVIQHEFDHTIGVEFTEKVSDYKKLMSQEHYISQIKSQTWHMKNCEIRIKDFVTIA